MKRRTTSNLLILLRMFFLFFTAMLFGMCSYTGNEDAFKLSQEQYAYIKPYKPNDTISFKNNTTNEVDSFIVEKIDTLEKKTKGYLMALPAELRIGIRIKLLPPQKWYSNIQRSNYTTEENQDLIYIVKMPQDNNRCEIVVSYRNFSKLTPENLGPLIRDTIHIGQFKLTNYYKLENDYAERGGIETIYWTTKYGLTAYKTDKNEWWYIAKMN